MDWKTASTLNSLGNERAIAVPIVLDEELLYSRQDRHSPLEAYGVRDIIENKLQIVLGAVGILRENYKIATATNIARVSNINTQKGDAVVMSLTELGLFVPEAKRIYPYNKLARYKGGRTTWVRKWEINKVMPIFNVTELGRVAMDDENIADKIKKSVEQK